MMRTVAYVTPYPPQKGGIADYAVCFQKALEQTGRYSLRVLQDFERRADTLAQLWRLKRLAGRRGPEDPWRGVDLVHAEIGWPQHAEFFLLFWLQQLRPQIPCCLTVHDPPLVVAPVLQPLSCGSRAALVRKALRVLDHTPLGRGLTRLVLYRTRRVFVLSQAGRDRLQQFVPRHPGICYLPHVAYRDSGPVRVLSADPRREVKVMFLGFWHPKKGMEILVQAFAEAVRKSPIPLRLVLTGQPNPNTLEKDFAQKIHGLIDHHGLRASVDLPGYLPLEQLDAALDAADLVVAPYLSRQAFSSSGVLHRAMASGVAIVASELGGLREDIRHDETGWLIPPDNLPALVEAILVLAQRPELRWRLGQQAQARIFAHHSRSRVAALVEAEYAALL